MSNCAHCPLKGADMTCPRWTAAHPRFCEWVDPVHPARIEGGAEALVRIAMNMAGRGTDQIAGRSSDQLAAEPEQARLSVAASLDLIRRMKACPAFEKTSDCGCGVNRCKLGKGRSGLVTQSDCMDCLNDNGKT